MKFKVDMLMEKAILLMGRSESVFGMSSNMMRPLPPKPSRQEAFKDLVINFILDQEEKVKQLEEYMSVIGSGFMQLSLEVVEKLKEEIGFPSLEVDLGYERGPEPPIKPLSLDSFRKKHQCLDDPKKHYGFKPGLLGHSGSVGVDFLKLEIIKDDWELEFKEEITYIITCKKFFKENENKIFSEAGDGVRVYPEGVVSPAIGKFENFQVILDKKKLGTYYPNQPIQLNKITSSCEIYSDPHDTQYCMENLKQAFVEYESTHANIVGGKPFTTNHGPKTFNEVSNTWKDKPNFSWERTQTFKSPQRGSISTYSSNASNRPTTYQTNLEKIMTDFDSHQEKRLSSLRTQLQQQQDDMSNKLNTLWKICSKMFNIDLARGDSTNNATYVSAISFNDSKRTEPQNKGIIEIPSKLLSLKYHKQSSLQTIDEKNPSPKQVYFVNTITIVKKEERPRDKPPREHNGLTDIKNLEPSWVNDEIRDEEIRKNEEVGNEGEWLDTEESLDLVATCEESVYESLIKEMPRCSLNYDFRIKKGDPRNIVGRSFIEEACLAINRKHGFMTFTNEIIVTFKTPYKDPERSDLTREGHDLLSSRVVLSEDDYDHRCRKPSDLENKFYKGTIELGPKYQTELNKSSSSERDKNHRGVT
nr:hypothetical protein [Tanacetum cinerariifolium]